MTPKEIYSTISWTLDQLDAFDHLDEESALVLQDALEALYDLAHQEELK